MEQRATASAILMAAAGTCACLAITGAVRFPLLWYEPLSGSLRSSQHHSSVAMDWYARCALSLIVGGVLFFAARLRAKRRPVSSATFRLILGWSLLAFTLVAGFYGWTLKGRRSLPEPLPAGYQPR